MYERMEYRYDEISTYISIIYFVYRLLQKKEYTEKGIYSSRIIPGIKI